MIRIIRNAAVLALVALLSLSLVPPFFSGSMRVVAASGVFPKMTPASTVQVVDLRNDSAEARLSALALQGLVNQTAAGVYVLTRDTDQTFLDASGKPYTVLPPLGGSNPGLRTLFKQYQSRVKELIVYDPTKDWTFDLALMEGAIDGGIPVPQDLEQSLVSEFGWQGTVVDIRNNWTDRVSAYEWARANLMPKLNTHVLFSAGLRSDWQTAPWSIYDYVVATKSFVFWLDDTNTAEKQEIQKICQTPGYPSIAPIMGYGYNGDGLLNTVEPYGFGWQVSDFFANGSVWSSFPDKTYTQAVQGATSAQPGKIYVSIYWSDGDNVQFDEGGIAKLWSDPARGSVPVGTTLAPSLQELAPPILDWY